MTTITQPVAIARCPLPEPNVGKVLVVIASATEGQVGLSKAIFEALLHHVPNDGQRSILFSDVDRQIWQQVGLHGSMSGLRYTAEVIGHGT